MFLEATEMKSVMYQYQLAQITENDDSIIEMGINAATEEVLSYLTPNSQKQWQDGRKVYDVEAVFSATGTDRNALILELTKTVSEWWIIRLCNADVIYEHVKERYDRAIDFLTKIAKGTVTVSGLPTKEQSEEEGETTQPFRFGSRTKFNHE